ncbi:D-alanyl-D-alanine carboxypeptidase [Lysinibacillus agricola]|uniref:D-alanyl-D-alanine carboxypeptidase n=1 Tax=Lysinibacillus agricola TaxID=2590012 RepID=A0ABX7AQP0_9BACI|nr:MULTISPECIES: serine hydrolase [Lysinibacillus]KOS63696.1 penicillin-binding protein [Lysinibacillus sp. FJAT-14222]QQP10564.1 D-alanyl-D-alanine carboxypeptidase [Lysinibacillus agricola]
MKKFVLFCCICAAAIFFYYTNNTTTEQTQIELPSLHSKNALLLNEKGGVLYEKNADAIIYPASLTKIMTAIVAIEVSADLQKQTIVEPQTISKFTAQNASMAGFMAGDFVTIEDLLYGTLLASGADATGTLADTIAGSEEAFVTLMNNKAHELGMNDTHFVNASGLHDDAHVSSVRDISKLFHYAIKNPTFYQILTSKSYITHVPNELTITSSLLMKVPGGEGVILGGKTGYTPEAGLCLASIIEKDGKHYIFVTTNANGQAWTPPFHIEDALTAYDAL